jgi:LacI family transcriptional regulator
MKRTSIQDLAKLLSLNPSTISRALSNHKDVNAETRQRVLEAAKEFNYVPNLHARYFRKKNSGLVALILPEFNMFFTHSIMAGINEVLTQNGFTLIVFYSNNSLAQETEIVRHCISWVVEGVLMVVGNETQDLNHLQELKIAEVPTVLFDKVIPTAFFTTVTIDDASAAEQATDYLITNNARRVLGIFANKSLDISQQRQLGFSRACSKRDISCDSVFVQQLDQLDTLIGEIQINTYDAIFMMSDELILNTLGSLHRLKIDPNLYKMSGISDGIFPKSTRPFIPHILHSGLRIGQIAAEELIANINAPDQYAIKQNKVQTSMISEP